MLINETRKSTMAEKHDKEGKSDILKHIKAIMVTLVTVIFTALLTWYLPKYLEQQQVEISFQEMELSGDRYVYLIGIANKGKVSVQDLDLLALVNGKVYSSMFNGSPTTHDPHFRFTKSPFDGKFQIKDEDLIKTIQYPYSNDDNSDDRNSIELLKQKAQSLISSNSSVWYKLNTMPFYLTVDEQLKAAIITDKRIDNNKIKCNPNPEICNVSNTGTISTETFERIFGVLSVQQGNISNKIFGSGIGLSTIMIKGAATVDAKQKAIRAFYKDIVQKLYGVHIKSETTQFSEFSSKGDIKKVENVTTTNTVSILSEGMIDRSSAIVYHESSEQLSSGEIVYEIRGYYELPGEVEISDKYFRQNSAIVLPSAPIEYEGVEPEWVRNDHIDDNEIFTSVGISDSGTPYRVAKIVAANRALVNMSLKMTEVITKMIKQYTETTGIAVDKDVMDNIVNAVSSTKILTDNTLIGARIIAYYKDKNDQVHALASIASDAVEWNVKNELHNHDSDRALWEQFKAKKTQDGLAAEIMKMEMQ